ncbi:MAG TPA: type I DNA topoisomerase [Actinomycetota bacterium]|nr:type I DNA topoisomerase [Actinomycetota bacterium]
MTETNTIPDKATKAAPKRRKPAASRKKPAARKRAPAKAKKGSSRAASGGGSGHLVIVESPTKAKTLTRYLTPVLGRGVTVKASYGHVRDLPESKLGVDTEKAFDPTYEILSGSKKVVSQLKSAAKRNQSVWLATDLDREGEAIAWHVAYAIGLANGRVDPRVRRVVFAEITPEAIEQAFRHPRAIDKPLVDAYQARRVLDRLVGYKLSPLLWKKVRPGLSAGRVQSVALRLVVDREREIEAFVAEEYWTIEVPFDTEQDERFTSSLHSVGGKKIEIPNEEAAKRHVDAIRAAGTYTVTAVRKREQRQNPPRPFITSTLQQEAARKLGFSARRTMVVAQQLYEGIELGAEGQTGLITYMRTDSTHLAPSAVQEIREAIKERYGDQYLPPKPRVYRSKKGAQEAHEAIRPTHASRHPDAIESYLEPDQLKLYRLIWDRTIACQMNEVVFDGTSVDITAGDHMLRATGRVMLFDGFLVVYREGRDDEDEEAEGRLPDLTENQPLRLVDVIPSQHFTQPPPRYTEASLVKALEEHGIGRPSTYAATLSTLVDREYISIDQRRIFPTDVGKVVTDLLVEHFPQIVDLKFTASMEEDLDEIARGHKDWPEVLRQFYDPFERLLEKKDKEITRDDVIKETTEEKCPVCGSEMTVKLGRYGKFLSCSKYPECKGTRQIDGSQRPEPQVVPGEVCEECGSPMLLKHGRYGEFLGCSKYPECKFVKSKTIGGSCPKCNEGKLAQRRTRRGKAFYGCTRYPDCDYALWTRPLDDPCPKCGGTMTPDDERGGVCLSCGHAAAPAEATASSTPDQASSG